MLFWYSNLKDEQQMIHSRFIVLLLLKYIVLFVINYLIVTCMVQTDFTKQWWTYKNTIIWKSYELWSLPPKYDYHITCVKNIEVLKMGSLRLFHHLLPMAHNSW